MLDTLVGKEYFSFLDGFSGIIKLVFQKKTRTKPPLHVPGAHMPTRFYLLAYVMPQLPFRGQSWPSLQISFMSVLKFTWMIFLYMEVTLKIPWQIWRKFEKDVLTQTFPSVMKNVL